MGPAATFKLMSIGIIIISFVVGLIFFYMISYLSKEQRKAQIEEIVSQLINFIIFIWIGKIILNFSIFIKDPLAILAYPSNAEAFYLAVLFSAILLFYKAYKKKFDVLQLATSFLSVFLMAYYLYEFIQIIVKHNTYSFENLTLSTVLLVLFLIINGRLTDRNLIMTMLISWSAGMLILAYTQPFVTVFGYMIAPWFVGLFLRVNLFFIIFGKRDLNERN